VIARALLLAALLAALVAWDAALARRAAHERTETTHDVGRLISEERLKELDVAAIRLEWSDGRPAVTYARVPGSWRCVEAFAAPADAQAVEGLIGAITEAEGYVQSDDPGQAAAYGIGTRETVRFQICGPNVLTDRAGHDVQWSVDIGRSLPGGDGAFLRPAGTAEIWAVDQDPRAALEQGAAPGLPPLLDPTLLTKTWLAGAGGITHIFIDRADGSALELATRPKELSEDELRQGAIPYEWVLDPSGEAVIVPAGRAMAYAYYLQAAGYRALLDPRRAEELGRAGPRDKLTLFPGGGDGTTPVEPLELHILAPVPGGGVPVANSIANTLLEVDPALAPLLLPTREELLDETAPNRWEAELDQGG
jgi:hypothetical protein